MKEQRAKFLFFFQKRPRFLVILWIELFSKSAFRHNQKAIVSKSVYDAHQVTHRVSKKGKGNHIYLD